MRSTVVGLWPVVHPVGAAAVVDATVAATVAAVATTAAA